MGLLILILIGLLAIFLLVRKKRSKSQNQSDKEIGFKDYKQFTADKSISNAGMGATTLFNTYLGEEFNFPAFLEMNFTSDLRIELEFTRGGEASISQGTLISLFWREKYPAYIGDSMLAIKRFFLKPAATPQEQERANLKFQQEVAIIFALQESPNVIKLLGFTQNPNTLVMPLYLGDLTTLIHDSTRHKYSFADVLTMIKQVISGLRAIHAAKVAHRDFKPKNILLAPKETEERGNSSALQKPFSTAPTSSSFPYILQITDFGVAYLEPKNNELAKTDAVQGLKVINKFGLSYPYAAPEMFQHISDPSSSSNLESFQRADIFSFGVTLWELIHRQMPWAGNGIRKTPKEIETAVISGNRPPITFELNPPTTEIPQISIALQWIKECWDQDPSQRPTAEGIAKQLPLLLQENDVKVRRRLNEIIIEKKEWE